MNGGIDNSSKMLRNVEMASAPFYSDGMFAEPMGLWCGRGLYRTNMTGSTPGAEVEREHREWISFCTSN